MPASKRARHPGVYWRGASWAYVVSLPRDSTGRRRQEWRSGFPSATDAHAARIARLAELGRGEGVGTPILLRDLVARWLRQVGSTRKPRTLTIYTEQFTRHLEPALGHIRIDRLSVYHVEDYLRVKSAALSAQTLSLHHSILHQSLRAAVRWGMVGRNVVEMVARPVRAPRRFPILTTAQTTALLAATRGAWIYTPILLAAAGALRIGECLALRWEDVDGSALHVRRNLAADGSFGTPKSGAEDTVTLPRFAAAALEELRQPSGLVCAGPFGRPVRADYCRRLFYAALEAAGLPRVRFHDLRHGASATMFRAGVPAPTVARKLRHSSPVVTLTIYAHVLDEDERQAAEALEKALNGAG